jgi:hypothetical protein
VVAHLPSKQTVAGSNPVSRSTSLGNGPGHVLMAGAVARKAFRLVCRVFWPRHSASATFGSPEFSRRRSHTAAAVASWQWLPEGHFPGAVIGHHRPGHPTERRRWTRRRTGTCCLVPRTCDREPETVASSVPIPSIGAEVNRARVRKNSSALAVYQAAQALSIHSRFPSGR